MQMNMPLLRLRARDFNSFSIQHHAQTETSHFSSEAQVAGAKHSRVGLREGAMPPRRARGRGLGARKPMPTEAAPAPAKAPKRRRRGTRGGEEVEQDEA